jgi:hypothetical protein
MASLSTEDLQKMAQFWYTYRTSELPGKIAADPRMAELAKAAGGTDAFIKIMERTPVNRAGTILPTASAFIAQYAPVLTPPTAPQKPQVPATATTTATPTQTATQPVQASPIDLYSESAMKKMANLYYTTPWSGIQQAAFMDPELQAMWRQSEAAGLDPTMLFKYTPYNAQGQFVASSLPYYQKLVSSVQPTQPTVSGTGAPAATQAQMQEAATKLQQSSPMTGTASSGANIGQPTQAISPTGVAQSLATGAPKQPDNTPLAQQITSSDLGKTGVTPIGTGSQLAAPVGQTNVQSVAPIMTPKVAISSGTTIAPVGSTPQIGGSQAVTTGAPKPAATIVDLQEGMNRFNPDLVQQNMQELQMARLSPGHTGPIMAQGREAQGEAIMKQPWQMRNDVLQKYRAGTIKPQA